MRLDNEKRTFKAYFSIFLTYLGLAFGFFHEENINF